MRYGEASPAEQSREAANSSIIEATREAVDQLCKEMIRVGYTQLVEKVAEDAEQLELYEASGFPQGKTVDLFVVPDLRLAPMVNDEPRETLTLLLQRSPWFDCPPGQSMEDCFRVLIPVTDEYVYPGPLDEQLFPDEIYLEFIPGPFAAEGKAEETESQPKPHARYIVSRDDTDPKGRFAIYAYESDVDTDPTRDTQVIHDAFSERVMLEALKSRIPESAVVASELIKMLGDFNVIHQTSINPHE